MNHSAITVLMPVYNAEKYLQAAMESILSQTYTHFDFLIVDDGSTDNSIAIIQSFADSRIRLVQNEKNIGIAATLNKGIELSTNELIARMDADDISYPQRLQKQVDYMAANKDCALLSTAARMVTIDRKPISTDDYKSQYFFYNLIFQCWIYHPTVMYQRRAVQEVGGYNTPWSEDFDLWWRLSRKYKTDHLEEVLLDYRLTDESLCRVVRKEEYETAQDEQTLRNIHYYTGNEFYLSSNELQCLRHNFEPILSENNIDALIKCMNKLEHINKCVLKKENTNAYTHKIKEAAYYKRKFMLHHLLHRFSKKERLWFYLRTNSWEKLYRRQSLKTKAITS